MPRSTKVKSIRARRPVAKMLEAAAEEAGDSFNNWAKRHLRRAALRELGEEDAPQDDDA